MVRLVIKVESQFIKVEVYNTRPKKSWHEGILTPDQGRKCESK